MISMDVKIQNILYATDLNDNARYAFAYALSLANQYAANLILLHVLPETPDLADKNVIGYIGQDKWEAIKQDHYHDAMMGSTARRVVRRSLKPVLVVRLPEDHS